MITSNMIVNKENSERFKICLYSSIIVGLIAHGMMIFNKISYHDDICDFTKLSCTYTFGRWTQGWFQWFNGFAFGTKTYSLSTPYGIVALLSIGFISFFILDYLNIKNKFIISITTGVLVCFPSVTSTFGYMFEIPYYFLGSLAGVFGAYVYYRKKTFLTFVVCSFLMAFGVGVYQANIPVFICSLLLFMLKDVCEKN